MADRSLTIHCDDLGQTVAIDSISTSKRLV